MCLTLRVRTVVFPAASRTLILSVAVPRRFRLSARSAFCRSFSFSTFFAPDATTPLFRTSVNAFLTPRTFSFPVIRTEPASFDLTHAFTPLCFTMFWRFL